MKPGINAPALRVRSIALDPGFFAPVAKTALIEYNGLGDFQDLGASGTRICKPPEYSSDI